MWFGLLSTDRNVKQSESSLQQKSSSNFQGSNPNF